MDAHSATLTVAVALAAGLFAQFAARRLAIPGIVLLLALGVLLGPEGLQWLDPGSLGGGLFGLVDFGVAVVLFEGGLNLQWSRLLRQELPVRRLITVGAALTVLGAAFAVHALLDWSWSLAFLFGSLVVVTGPTVVTPLLRDMRLHPRLKTILEAEGVFIDPIGAILAALVLQIAMVPDRATVTLELGNLVLRLGFGIIAGAAAGALISWVLRFRFFVPRRYESVFALASVLLIFEGCNAFVVHSGILAVTIAGVVVGNVREAADRDLREFKDQLTVLLVGLLFILLAADIPLAEVRALGTSGATLVAVLILIVRPLSVWISTLGADLSVRERLFMAWLAPRGIVAAAVASLTAATMQTEGMGGGSDLRALVFLTIAGTVVLAGATARPLASLLRLRLPSRDRMAILGANGLGLALGTELRTAGVDVVFLDSDPKRCQQAEQADFPVIFGDALEERTLLRGQFELVGTVIGLTFNEHLNSLFVGQVRQLFEVPRGYVALESLYGEEVPAHVKEYEGEVLFEAPHDQERWDVRWRHREVAIEHLVFRQDTTPSAESKAKDEESHFTGTKPAQEERFVMLTVKRKAQIVPMSLGFEPQAEDEASVAIHLPEREDALRALAEQGWQLKNGTVEGDAE